MIEELRFVVEGIVVSLLACLGVVVNVLSILVLRSNTLDMKLTFRNILILLAVFDGSFVVLCLLGFSLPVLFTYYKLQIHPYVFPKLLPWIQISLSGSIWTIVVVGMERYNSVSATNARQVKVSKGLVYICPVVLFSVIWNIPRFFELQTCEADEVFFNSSNLTLDTNSTETLEVNESYICPTSLRQNIMYCRDYVLIANSFSMTVIPIGLLIVLNSRLWLVIRQNKGIQSSKRKARDIQIAKILILIVLMFLICNIPRIIINVFEVYLLMTVGPMSEYWPTWCQVMSMMSHLFLVASSSSNLFIYCYKDRKFRTVLCQLIGLKTSSQADISRARRNAVLGRNKHTNDQVATIRQEQGWSKEEPVENQTML